MLKPIHLQTLAVVVRTGSFSVAGRELGYTASAVAQQVAALERALGVQLFDREPHRIRPTAAAVFIAERSHHALAILDSLEHDGRAMANGHLGRLGIGTALDAGSPLLAEALTLLKSRPGKENGLDVHLSHADPDDLIERVHLGSLDLALIYDYPLAARELSGDLRAHTFHESPLQLATPTAWGPDWKLADLADRDWLVSVEAPAGPRVLTSLCAAVGFLPHIRTSTSHTDTVLSLVAAGQGVGLVPPVSWPVPASVTLRSLEETGATRRTVAIYQGHRTNPTLHAALRALCTAARPLRVEPPISEQVATGPDIPQTRAS